MDDLIQMAYLYTKHLDLPNGFEGSFENFWEVVRDHAPEMYSEYLKTSPVYNAAGATIYALTALTPGALPHWRVVNDPRPRTENEKGPHSVTRQ